MIRKASPCFLGVAAIALLAGAAGCAPSEPTQIIAGMVTQMRVPEEIRSVGLVVQSGGKQVFCENYQVDDETRTVTLPSTFAASSRGDVTKPLTITVLGFPQNDPTFEADCYVERTVASGASAPSIMRRRRSTFVQNEMLYMPMPLRHSCEGVQCDDNNETCVAGKCQSLVGVAAEALGVYGEDIVFGRASTCFDVSKCANPGDANALRAVLKDRKTCTFEVKTFDNQRLKENDQNNLNVSIVHDNFTWEVLDYDEHEGFFFPIVGGENMEFRLAEGLCKQRFHRGKMADVMVNVGCPNKHPLQPLCESNQKGIIGGTLGPLSVANLPPLVAGSKLNSVDFAVFILLDDNDLRSELIEWQGPDESDLIRKFREILDNPLMSNLHIGITVPSKVGESQFDVGDGLSGTFDPEKQSADGFFEWLYQQTRGWSAPSSLGSPGWFDGEEMIRTLKDDFVGHNAIVVITDRGSPEGMYAGDSAGGSVGTVGDFSENAKDEAGSNTYVLLTNEDTMASGEAWGEKLDNSDNSVRPSGKKGYKWLEELSEILFDSMTCKYKKPEALRPDSVISYLEYGDGGNNEKKRVQISPCKADAGDTCDGWKDITNPKEGGVSYIEVKGNACEKLRKLLGSTVGTSKVLEGLIPEVPLYISSQ